MKLSWLGIILSLAGFIIGFRLLQAGLGRLVGSRWQEMLAHAAATPARGLLAGTVITAVLQSSSVVTAVTVGLAGTEVLSLEQALGIVLGSNIGTSFAAQLLALHPGIYAVLPLVAGLFLLRSPARYRPWGYIGTGLGLLYTSLILASWSAVPLAAAFQEQLIEVIPERGFLLGAVATAVLQSSSVIVALAMALAESHLLSPPAAVAIMLGANVGTCFTALVAGWASNRPGRQVALAHLFLNLAGGLLLLPFSHEYAAILNLLTASPARQVATGHLLYNLISSLVALPFIPAMARLLMRGGR